MSADDEWYDDEWYDDDLDYDDDEVERVVTVRYFQLIRFGEHALHKPVSAVPEGVEVIDLGSWQANATIIDRRISLARATDLLSASWASKDSVP
jgi:hypothetical protein